MKYVLILITSIFPAVSFAAEPTLQILGKNLFTFANNTLLPLIVGIAFLFLIINVVRYFIIQGASEDGREHAKTLALYGVFAFVLLVIFWGIVNLLASTIGLNTKEAPTSDYITRDGPAPGPTVVTAAPTLASPIPADPAPVSPVTPADSSPVSPVAPVTMTPPLLSPPPTIPAVDNSPVAVAVKTTLSSIVSDRLLGAPDTKTLGAIDTVLGINSTSINDATANEATVVAIKELEAAGLANASQVSAVIGVVNERRIANGDEPIDPTRITIEPSRVTSVQQVFNAQEKIAEAIYDRYPPAEEAVAAQKVTEVLTALQGANFEEARAIVANAGVVVEPQHFEIIEEIVE